jgi:Arc/MetJ family transcription regulator
MSARQTIGHTPPVRTTLDLDDGLLASLMARLSGVSETEAIQQAVRFYLTHDAVDQLRQLAGTLEIDDVSRSLRAGGWNA